MSGPWDRPSPDSGAEWPSEDLDSPRSAEPREPEGDAWASGDLWSESPRDAGSEWGDWPAPAPPSDEYVVDEPQPTLSDPWAESWSDESEHALAQPEDRWAEGPAEVPQPPEPSPPPSFPEPTSFEPAPPESFAHERETPLVQPWAVDTDPWSAAAPAEAEAEAEAEATSVEPPPPALPDWLAEPEPEPDVAEQAPGPEPETAYEPAPAPITESAGFEPASEEEPSSDLEPEAEEDAESSWRRFVPWAASAAVETPEPDIIEAEAHAPGTQAPEAQVEEQREVAQEPEAEPEPAPAPESTVGADVQAEDDSSSAWRRLAPWAAGAAAVPPEPDADEAEPTAEAEVEHAPPEAELEPEPPREVETEPEADVAAAAEAEVPADEEAPSSPWRRLSPFAAGAAGAASLTPEPDVVDTSTVAEPEWAAAEEPGLETAADVAAEDQQPEPDAEPEAEQEPELAAEAEAPAEEPAEPAMEAEAPADEQPTSRWRRLAPWGAGAAAAAAAAPAAIPEPQPQAEADDGAEVAGAEPETDPIAAVRAASPWAEPEVVESPAEPEPSWSADDGWAALAEPEPDTVEAPAEPAPEAAMEGVPESTQVFPTTWTPPPPPPTAESSGSLEPVGGDIRTRLAAPEADLDEDLEPESSTAEQAVPWLIGFILLLAGMVIVLLALIFAGDQSLSAGIIAPSASASVAAGGSATPIPLSSVAPSASAAGSATPAPSPTPLPVPEYGPLEMIYQGRAAALAPIYLLRHDFTTEDEPVTLAQDDSLDVRRFAWAPDGTIGAGLLADVLVSIQEGQEKRRLGDGIMTITFGDDAQTVYAVRITEDGANDVATVMAVDFLSGDTTELASINYPRPDVAAEEALAEAQFADEGGAVRLFWMENGMLRLWSLGAGTWEISPEDGEVTDLEEALPVLWSPMGDRRVTVEEEGGTSTISLVDEDGDAVASTTAEGLVSHLRWSPAGDRVAFTLGRSASGGGILQNLWLWDLRDGQSPMQLTSTGAAFGVEWRGTAPLWRE